MNYELDKTQNDVCKKDGQRSWW